MNLFLPLSNRRWRRTLGVATLVLAALCWFAPALLVRSPLWPRILAYVTKDLEARVQTESVSLGWISPICARHVTLHDAAGTKVLQCESIELEKGLCSLLLNPSQLGTIRIRAPQATVVFDESGSNLERLLAPLLTGPSSTAPPPRGRVEIVDGRVDLTDSLTGDEATIRDVHAELYLPGAPSDAQWGCRLHQCIVATGGVQGSCQADVRWGATGASSTDAAMHVVVAAKTHRLALSVLQPMLRRLEPQVQLAGFLSSDVKAEWDPAKRHATAFIQQLAVESLDLVAPSWLGQDRLHVEQLVVKGKCRLVGNQLQLDQLELSSDLANALASGTWTWQTPASSGPHTATWLDTFVRGSFVAEGSVDVAQLAATLPHTLQIRPDTNILSGLVTVHLRNQPHQHGRLWSGQLDASDLSARRDGQPLVWEQPLELQLQVLQTPEQLTIKQLHCRSKFLQLTGSGTSREGQITCRGDLNQLKRELGQLMDLEPMQLAGTLTGQLDWQLPPGGAITLSGSAQLKQLAFQRPGSPLWQEPQLSVTASATGTMKGSQIHQLSKASVSIRSATDQLVLSVPTPVQPFAKSVSWPVHLQVRGGWSSWLARIRPFASLPPATVEGTLDVDLKAQVRDDTLNVSAATFQSQPFRFDSPSLRINEPLVKLEAAGRWDRNSGTIKLDNGVFRSSAIAMRAEHVATNWNSSDRQLTGEFSARANLETLTNLWQLTDGGTARWRLRGLAQCSASLADQAGVVSAKWKASLENGELLCHQPVTDKRARLVAAAAGTHWVTLAREPNLQLAGAARFNPRQGTLNMDHLELTTADKQRLTAKGSVSDLQGNCVADLTGEVTYDLAVLLDRARPFLGDSVRAIGRDTQTFALQGSLRNGRTTTEQVESGVASVPQPMVSPDLSGHCGFSWTAADLLGIAVGSGKLRPQLSQGTIETGVIEFPLSQGRFRLEPHFYLNQQPASMTIEPGQVLDAVEISENMCAGWLKFVTPMVAEATRAKGIFSLKLESANVPLLRPADASVRGELHIQQAAMGPGPLAASLVKVVAAVEGMIKTGSSGDATPLNQDQFYATAELLGRAAGLPGPPSSPAYESPSRYQLNIPEQFVPFRVAEGRVYHDQFHVVVGDVTVITQGSVGIDQSLHLVAYVPIRRQWVDDPRLWRVLEGKSLEIPVTGTMRKPKIDTGRVEQSLRQLAGDLLWDSSGRMLERELQRGLNQLFRQ